MYLEFHSRNNDQQQFITADIA